MVLVVTCYCRFLRCSFSLCLYFVCFSSGYIEVPGSLGHAFPCTVLFGGSSFSNGRLARSTVAQFVFRYRSQWFFCQNRPDSFGHCDTFWKNIPIAPSLGNKFKTTIWSLELIFGVLQLVSNKIMEIFQKLSFYFAPVLPNPLSPRAVCDSFSTSAHTALSCLAMINCAMRSPFSMVKSSLDKFTRTTPISPL